jgi:hypothetical protein
VLPRAVEPLAVPSSLVPDVSWPDRLPMPPQDVVAFQPSEAPAFAPEGPQADESQLGVLPVTEHLPAALVAAGSLEGSLVEYSRVQAQDVVVLQPSEAPAAAPEGSQVDGPQLGVLPVTEQLSAARVVAVSFQSLQTEYLRVPAQDAADPASSEELAAVLDRSCGARPCSVRRADVPGQERLHAVEAPTQFAVSERGLGRTPRPAPRRRPFPAGGSADGWPLPIAPEPSQEAECLGSPWAHSSQVSQ